MKRWTFPLLFLLIAVTTTSTHGAHHEVPAPAIKYVLTQGIKTTDLAGTAKAAQKFLRSGALEKRGVGMGFYGVTANSGSQATAFFDYYYPSGKNLPPANVQIDSGPHVEFLQSMKTLNNEVVFSQMQSTIVEVLPVEKVGENKVFYVYYLQVGDPRGYVSKWKNLMKKLERDGIAPSSYGLREIMAGGENNETHVIWMGYSSMEELAENYNATGSSETVAAFVADAASMRSISRTSIFTQLTLDTAEIFE